MDESEDEVTETKTTASKPRVRRTPEERAAQLRAQAEAAEYRAKLGALRSHPVARELATAHAHLGDAFKSQPSDDEGQAASLAIQEAVLATHRAIAALGFDVSLVVASH